MVAGVLAAVGIATGIVLFITTVLGSIPHHTFAPGETVTVQLKRDPRPGFFVTDAGSPTDTCSAQASNGQRIPAQPISGAVTVSDNGTEWHLLSRLRLPADGTYQVTCAKTATNAGARYAIGTPPEAIRIVLGVLIAIGTVGIGVVITIVTAVRRGSYRRRMTPPPGYSPPPGYY